MKIDLYEEFTKVLNRPWTTLGDDVQVCLQNNKLYVQCSDSRLDWRHNFMFGVSVYNNSDIPIYSHRGFKKLWLSIKDAVEQMDFHTIVAYSQGSGITHHIHENFVHRFGKEPLSIAFASPRVYWRPVHALAARFTNFHHIVTSQDLVHRVPPRLFGYEHVGQEHVLAGTAHRPKGTSPILYASHHTPEEYLQRLASTDMTCYSSF